MIHCPEGQYPEPGPDYLAPTHFLDFTAPALQGAVAKVTADAKSDIDKAVRLFYWVRDGWRYDPFASRVSAETHIASTIHQLDYGYCISKAILLTAAARAAGIPAALGFANVNNHLTSDKLKRWMGGNLLFVFHGYSVLHLDGRWIKAAPAFNLEMCQRFGVRPTEFDGRSHAIFQEFDLHNRRHMEYATDHGCWSDFPYQRFATEMRAAYPVDLWEHGIEHPMFAPT